MQRELILETKRLWLRLMGQDDFPELCQILQDPDVMYAYEHAFSEEEVKQWLERQMRRYETDGFGLWAVIQKETGEMIGQAGLTLQDWDGAAVVEVGYLLKKDAWHQGYATEAAVACKEYAFDTLGCSQVYSMIRENKRASQRVAERNGMKPVGTLTKHYYGMDMPHIVYRVDKPGISEKESF